MQRYKVDTKKVVIYNILVVIGMLGVIEWSLGFHLDKPNFIPDRFVAIFQEYYWKYDGHIIQFDQTLAQYDKDLFYTLKPNTEGSFENREFKTSFSVNSLGVRDDEKSLKAPQVVVLGDSHGMGWGVESNETFAGLMKGFSGKKILNTSISSYGTARQFEMLKRVDTSNLETIVIQYCSNDFEENVAYIENGMQLKTSDQERYYGQVAFHQSNESYYPFKHTIQLLSIYKEHIAWSVDANLLDDKHYRIEPTEAFLDILNHHIDSSINVIVINMETNHSPSDFVNVTEVKNKAKNIRTVDFSRTLKHKHFYRLDGHLNADGHRIVAEKLIRYL